MRVQYAIGWFGIPGGPESRSTKTHIVHWHNEQPVCGSVLGSKQEFQFCSHGTTEITYLECERCIKWRKAAKESVS